MSATDSDTSIGATVIPSAGNTYRCKPHGRTLGRGNRSPPPVSLSAGGGGDSPLAGEYELRY